MGPGETANSEYPSAPLPTFSLLYAKENRRSKGPAVRWSAAEDAIEEALELAAANRML